MDDDEPAGDDVELSNSASGYLSRDEWMDDSIPFPTKSDALLASYALSKDADPFMVDKFLSLIRNPSFNPAECTLHSVADIHSFTTNYRREIRNNISGDSPSTSVPNFIWEEVISRIGTQWVTYMYRLLDDAAQDAFYAYGDGAFQFIREGHQSMFDLRCASLVHRSWTRVAQRQLGRVLVLYDADEPTLTNAIQSGLYGNWTQILVVDGSPSRSTIDGWGVSTMVITDTLSPNQSRLKGFIARFPYLTLIHFDSTYVNHPLTFVDMIKPSISLENLSILSFGSTINQATTDVINKVRRWPGLKKLKLVGFALDLNVENFIESLLPSLSDSQITSLSISGSIFNLHSRALIHSISWARNPSLSDPERFIITEAKLKRTCTGTQQFASYIDVTRDEETVNFDDLADEASLSWLPSIENLHVANLYESEARQIFDMTTSVRHLSWSGLSFTPTVGLPASLRSLQLFSTNPRDETWHSMDRQLCGFLRHYRNPDLQHVVITVQLYGHPQVLYSEPELEFSYTYFPRSVNLCKSSNISFSVDL